MDPTRLPHAPHGPRFGAGLRQEPSKVLGLTIPPLFLGRADEVIQ